MAIGFCYYPNLNYDQTAERLYNIQFLYTYEIAPYGDVVLLEKKMKTAKKITVLQKFI